MRDVIAVQMTGPRTRGKRHRRGAKGHRLSGMDVGPVCGPGLVSVVLRPGRVPSGFGRSRPPIAPGGSRGIPDPGRAAKPRRGGRSGCASNGLSPPSGAQGAVWVGNPGASAPGYRLPPASRAVRQRLRTGRRGDAQSVSGPSRRAQSVSGPSRRAQSVSGPSRRAQSVSGPSRRAQGVCGPSRHAQSASGPSRHAQGVCGPTRHGQRVSGPSGILKAYLAPVGTLKAHLAPAGTRRRKPMRPARPSPARPSP